VAVTSVREIWNGREGEIDDALRRRFTRVFRVLTSSNLDGPETVRSHASIPQVGAAYQTTTETDIGALVKRVRVQQDQDEPGVWIAACEYDSEIIDPDLIEENPLDVPADIEWSTERYERAVETDQDGLVVRNSAKDPYDPPYTIPTGSQVLTIVRNEATYDPFVAHGFLFSVNTMVFFGKAAKSMLCVQFDGRRAFKNAVEYWVVTYKFLHRVDLWNPTRLLDAGYREVVSGNWRAIRDEGFPTSRPALLDNAGARLASGATPLYNSFRFYVEKDFGTLALP
jgi:hypothetical protein